MSLSSIDSNLERNIDDLSKDLSEFEIIFPFNKTLLSRNIQIIFRYIFFERQTKLFIEKMKETPVQGYNLRIGEKNHFLDSIENLSHFYNYALSHEN